MTASVDEATGEATNRGQVISHYGPISWVVRVLGECLNRGRRHRSIVGRICEQPNGFAIGTRAGVGDQINDSITAGVGQVIEKFSVVDTEDRVVSFPPPWIFGILAVTKPDRQGNGRELPQQSQVRELW